MPTQEIQLLILQIVRALVDEPLSVAIQCEELDGHTNFRIRVSNSDIGKVIGKQGRTARAIRTILAAVSMKTGARFSLDILEGGSQEAT